MIALGTILVPLLTASVTVDDDHTWPQWDGPARTGVSTETAWESAGREQDLWRVELGLGYSTVSVQDGRLFTMGYDKASGLDTVWCLDAMTGEVRWKHSYPSKIWDRAHEGGTVNTPTIDGDVVYSLNREGNLYCLKAETGEVVWHEFLMAEGNEYELEYPTWGFSASPLLVGEQLFLNCGRILSVERKTGKVLWRSKDFGHGYGTPIAFEHDGRKLIAAMNGTGVGVVSQVDGSEVYSLELSGKNRGIHSATPVLIEDSLFVSASTVPIGGRFTLGDGALEPVWQSREMVNSFSGCVRVGEHLYGFDGKVLKCIDFGGKTAWDVRGIGNGAVLAAGERLILMGGTGELIVAEATPTKFVELSRVELFDEGRFWTKPILVDGIVYCRNSKGALVARDHRQR